MSVDIRRLTEEDWAAVRTIRLRALETAPEVFGTTLDQEAGQPESFWRSRLADPLNAMVCGFDGHGAVAFAGLREGAGGNVRHRATIWGVFVAETHRSQRLGRQVMTALLALADDLPGIETTELNVRADNPSAIALYRSLDFHAIGTIPRALKHEGRYGDEVMMIRRKPDQPLDTP